METMTARQEEILQNAAYWLLRLCATESLPGDRVEDERMAWAHAREMFVVLASRALLQRGPSLLDCITHDQDEREWLMVNVAKMSHADCLALVMDGVRQMQETVDNNPWQYGVVMDRQIYVERGILTVVEAWDSLTEILTPR